jgi:hypothetical protein
MGGNVFCIESFGGILIFVVLTFVFGFTLSFFISLESVFAVFVFVIGFVTGFFMGVFVLATGLSVLFVTGVSL